MLTNKLDTSTFTYPYLTFGVSSPNNRLHSTKAILHWPSVHVLMYHHTWFSWIHYVRYFTI